MTNLNMTYHGSSSDYKLAINTTWLNVEPQATQAMQSTKTPEQLQKETEQSGWLSVWHEWSWWYPWYKMK